MINKRMQELDIIIINQSGDKQKRAEAEIVTKISQLKQIEDLRNKVKSEKKRIKKLLK